MPYKLQQWNDLIDQINSMVPDCPGVSELDKVSAPHRWSRRDIQEVQDKLRELCDDNEFTAIPELWKRSVIDEIEDAIANGACCCEEEDRDHNYYPDLNKWSEDGGYTLHSEWNANHGMHAMVDWVGWMKQEIEGPFTEEIPMAGGEVLEVESGGPAWVGRQFRRWEVYLWSHDESMPSSPIMEGVVKDGYLFVGTPEQQEAAIRYTDAIKEERLATVALSFAVASGDQEAIQEAQQTLNQKTQEREQAESDVGHEMHHWPWLNIFTGSSFLLLAQGPDSHSQTIGDIYPFSNSLYIPAFTDSPYVLKIPESDTILFEAILRLKCEGGE